MFVRNENRVEVFGLFTDFRKTARQFLHA